MHELSIAISIVELAERHAREHTAREASARGQSGANCATSTSDTKDTSGRDARFHSGAASISEIELEIGALAAVDTGALDFALESAVKGTSAENAKITRHIIPGEGVCEACGARVPMQTLVQPCPQCAAWQLRPTRGKELRVKSIVVGN